MQQLKLLLLVFSARYSAAAGQSEKFFPIQEKTDDCDGENGPIGWWDVSRVTDMSFIFCHLANFNADIVGWDVSNATNMRSMFDGASSFNSDISRWDVSSVTNMDRMFQGATLFNSDIWRWDVSSVTNMGSMFNGAASFNGDISKWDVSIVRNMAHMFNRATSFNRTLCGSWRTSTAAKDDMFTNSSGEICQIQAIVVKKLLRFLRGMQKNIRKSTI